MCSPSPDVAARIEGRAFPDRTPTFG